MENIYTSRVHGFPGNWTASLVGNGWATTSTVLSRGVAVIMPQEGLLSLVAVLGSSLSLVALVFAFITYSLFSDLRSVSGTTLMNLLAALFMTQLLYVVGVGGIQDTELCVSLSFSLQYLHLTVFFWLTALSHDLCRTLRRNMHVEPPPTERAVGCVFAVYSLLSWGMPLALLAAAYLYRTHHHQHHTNNHFLKQYNCWFLEKDIQMLFYLLPTVMLLFWQLYWLAKGAALTRNAPSLQMEPRRRLKVKRRRMMQLVLYLKIIALLTAVCLSGALATFTGWNAAWILFNIGHSVQGITVALTVTCNCRIIGLYARSIKRRQKALLAVSRSNNTQIISWSPVPDTV
ncbi:adhesion G protein-coupled receptor E3 [Nilaparvata lugens]|uniref:adhesion G protein-coupled receptor E3 n=1 Tax=Nilaparvata lugens TaxID=108931 RepID=UPI00193CE233|nr:adhesion G protein-coupled receptor E3 [Nilaparvata lugens]